MSMVRILPICVSCNKYNTEVFSAPDKGEGIKENTDKGKRLYLLTGCDKIYLDRPA